MRTRVRRFPPVQSQKRVQVASAGAWRRPRPAPAFVTLLVAGWLGTAIVGRAQVSREYDLKAVLLFNLTRFVEWPPTAFGDSGTPLVIGILGQDPFGKILDDVVRTESYGRHKITVARFRDIKSIHDCQILYVCAYERPDLPRILARVGGRPLLTVGDFEDFSSRGGMVGLNQNAAGRIRLRINLGAVRASGLAISGKLLSVAEIINPKVN